MNFYTTTYQIKDSVINKVYINHGWAITYNDLEKKLLTKPIEISNSILETCNNFCIRETKEELLDEIKRLALFETITVDKNAETIIEKAIKEVEIYSNKSGLTETITYK